jgi:peptidyl-tRNA hydrolase
MMILETNQQKERVRRTTLITNLTKRSRRLNCAKRLDLLQKMAAQVISFDFDDTLYRSGTHIKDGEFEKAGWNEENIEKVRQYLKEGYDVVVVTSRTEPEAAEAKRMLESIGLNLEVISAPGLGDGEKSKSDVLREIGAIKHFDDWVTDSDLEAARDDGVEIIQVESGEPDIILDE